jgi:hypothetical protein
VQSCNTALPGYLMPDTGTTSGLPVTAPALGVSKYMAHIRVLHVQRGFRMSKSYAEQVMRDHCTITWDIQGKTIRDTTDEERIALRAQQAQQVRLRGLTEGILGPHDLPNLRFERPKTTNYRTPRESYEEMESPLGVRVCRWPRLSHEFVTSL